MVIGFTRRMASAGYAYTYASRSLGKGAGFMAGWLYFFGMICFVPMTMSGVGYLAADLLGLNPKLWILFFFIGMVLFLVLSTIKVKVTTRVQLVIGIVTVAIILIVDLVTTAKGGSHGQAPSAFTFSHTNEGGFTGVFYGIIFGVTSYIGFETAADFGEETSNPRRYIPIAVIVATLFAVVFYLWTTYSITIGFGVNHGVEMGADPVALKTTATTFVGTLAWHAGRDRRHVRGVHRVRGLRHGSRADAVRDGPRGRAARGVRPDAATGSRRRSTPPSRWP